MNTAQALHQQALNYINRNQPAEAHQTLLQLDRMLPNNIDVYHLLSVVFGITGDYAQSEIYCKKALSINNSAALVYNNLGTAQKLQDKFAEAEHNFREAIRHQQDYIDAYVSLINLLLETGRINEAGQLVNSAMQKDSSNLALNLARANFFLKQEDNNRAIAAYECVLQAQPQNTDALINLGQIHEHAGDINKALKYYHDAQEIIPGYDQSIIGICSIMEKQGDYEKALELISPVLDSSANVKLHLVCGRLYSRLKDYPQAEKVLEDARDMVAIDQHHQELLFELGDVLDKQARYDEAFSTYSEANRINRLSFDREDSTRYFDNIKAVYNTEVIAKLASSDNDSERPVFIVGMPRSGTSLVEQILASHSQFFGGGELEDIDDIIYRLNSEREGTSYPMWVSNLDKATLAGAATRYLDRLNQLSSDAERVSNKMPHNFQHLGFIRQLFPLARIIHCRRNLKDTTLSIFFHPFNRNHPYACDLGDLKFYYQQYQNLMQHWEQKIGMDIHTVHYEELIENPEQECRKLLDACELAWEENCLNFHNNRRLVNTPSYHQVKQPLYKSAVNRNLHYSKYLTMF